MKPARLVEIREPQFDGKSRVYTTLEGENSGGSIKDHMVLGGLQALQREGLLSPGQTVAEASAGSTALSLAYHCHELAIRCALYVPDNLAAEKLERLRALGADVHAVPMSRGLELYGEFCKQPGIVPFNQLKDPGKKAHYHELGAWISKEIGPVDAILGAVGTGHSLLGIAEGMTPRPRAITAEPGSGEVPGVRNIETTRHGADDPCIPSLFDERTVLQAHEISDRATVVTSEGEIEFPESFKLVLSAASKLVSRQEIHTIFLVGAGNRRVSVDTPGF